MKKYFLALIGIVFVMPTAWGEISIQNDQKYVGDDGMVHIVGEIFNDLDVPLNQIKIHASLYSKSNQLIDNISSNSLVNNLMPGMKAPFDIMIIENNAQELERYDLDFEYKVGMPKNQVIDITSSKLFRDGFDNLVITGTLTNNGEITANSVSIIATLYDKQGNVLAVSKGHTKPDYLRSSDKVFFLVSVPDKIQTSSAVDYSLVAESEEYAAVPEFPFGSGVLLASSVFGYLILTKYWNRSIANVVAASDLR